jgi:catechol 2,3-dioxygenase-like lactoylglutathione lyase family enzyme
MLASGVHHLSFTVSDLERARAFYENVLGLESIPRPEMGIGGIWYSAGNAEIHLIELRGTDPKPVEGKISPLANHNAFAIDDYEAVVAFLKSENIEVLETNAERGQMWIRDPDGNVLELIAPPA